MNDEKQADEKEPFLARWSRRKLEQPVQEHKALQEKGPLQAATPVAPALPPVEKLEADSDFSGFMHPKVEDALRRVALKKLFSDPHFNVADPFEAYSGDWTGGEPIPEAMLASLEQMKQLLRQPEPQPQPVAKEDEPKPDEPGRQDA